MSNLKPCPFCGSCNVDSKEIAAAYCWECGATGPKDGIEDEAIMKWNTPLWECYRALVEILDEAPEEAGSAWMNAQKAVDAVARMGEWNI